MKNRLQELHPKTWLTLGGSSLLLALAPLPLAGRASLFCLLLTLFALTQKLRQFISYTLLGVGPVALLAWLIQTLTYRGSTVYLSWPAESQIRLSITAEGLTLGTQLALQILCFGAACAVASIMNTPTATRAALTDWKVPPTLIYLLVASLNAPSQLLRYAALVREAAQARGLNNKGLTGKARLGVQTAGALFNLILLEHETRGQALANRGFTRTGKRTFLSTYPDSPQQRYLRWGILLLALALTFFTYRGAL